MGRKGFFRRTRRFRVPAFAGMTGFEAVLVGGEILAAVIAASIPPGRRDCGIRGVWSSLRRRPESGCLFHGEPAGRRPRGPSLRNQRNPTSPPNAGRDAYMETLSRFTYGRGWPWFRRGRILAPRSRARRWRGADRRDNHRGLSAPGSSFRQRATIPVGAVREPPATQTETTRDA